MTVRIECPWKAGAGRLGRQPALIEGVRSISYSQLQKMAAEAGYRLEVLGVRPHDYVAIAAFNSINYILVLLALWRIGAVACLLSPRLPQAGIRDQLHKIGCRYLLTSLPALLESSKIEIPKTDLEKITLGNKGGSQRAQVVQFGRNMTSTFPLGQEVTVMFTSGTSGEPKAALHTFGNHYDNALGANEHIPVGPGDRWLLSLPLYHVGGLGIVFRVLLGKAAVVIPQAQEDISGALCRYRVTHLSLVSTQLCRLLHDGKNTAILRRLKVLLLGGGPIPDSLVRRSVEEGLPLYATYGLTEMASQVATSRRLTRGNPVPGAHVLKYRQVRLSKENEILVKGKTLFKGYLQKNGLDLPLECGGWFATGDWGSLNADGTLNVLGRKDNMFISGGENIQPEEIERHLCRIEGVVQAVVVPVKNEEFGARPAAFIQTKEGMRLSRTEILSSLRNYLPSFKLPEQIYTWPASVPQQEIKHNRSYFHRLTENAPSLQTIP